MKKNILAKLPAFAAKYTKPLQETEERIAELIRSEDPLLDEAAQSFLGSGGKRLRPLLLLVTADCGDFEGHRDDVIAMAAAVEMIHTASLIHDDIVDDAPLRRGRPTLHRRYGATVALSVGNIIVTAAMETILHHGNDRITATAIKVAREMCRGELSQLKAGGSAGLDQATYLQGIDRKTAYLMAAAAEIGAAAAHADGDVIDELSRFGHDLGVAFQITDDILDYIAVTENGFGKTTGNDLRDGLATMPLICAREGQKDPRRLDELFRRGPASPRAVRDLIELVKKEEGTEKAARKAQSYVNAAKAHLAVIDDTQVGRDLRELADFIAKRNF